MSLKSINESFERQFNVINDSKNEEFEVLESLRNLLSVLNEADMSDEDRRESDLIRSAYAKIQKRSNARLTPEEQAVLDKYGIKRNWDKKLHYTSSNPRNRDDTEIVDNPDDKFSHGKEIGRYYYDDGRRNGYRLNTKDQDKINYADRARKRPERAKNRAYDYTYTGYEDKYSTDDTGIIDYNNTNDTETPWYMRDRTRGVSQNTAINRMAQSKMNKMKGAIGARKSAQQDLDNAQAEFDRRKADADTRYMKAMQSAERDYDSSMDYYRREKERKSDPSRRDKAQADIDALLKRKKTEAVDLSDKKGSMTKVLSDNKSWSKETTVKGIADKVKSILDKEGIDTPASKRLIGNILKNKNYAKALETVYNSILAGANLSTSRGSFKGKKEESLKEAWSTNDLYSDVYNALADVMFKWYNAGYDLDANQVDAAYEWFTLHFWEDEEF